MGLRFSVRVPQFYRGRSLYSGGSTEIPDTVVGGLSEVRSSHQGSEKYEVRLRGH